MTQGNAKPSEARAQQRRQQKQAGRSRRAGMMLDKKAKEQARQDQLENRQGNLEGRVATLEDRLEAHESRLQRLEAPTTSLSTTSP